MKPKPRLCGAVCDVSISETDADVDANARIDRINRVVATAVFVPNHGDSVVIPVRRDSFDNREIHPVVPEAGTDSPARAVPANVIPVKGMHAAPVRFEEVMIETATVPVLREGSARPAVVVTAIPVVLVLVKLLLGSRTVVATVALDAASTVVLPGLALDAPAASLVTAATLSTAPVMLGGRRNGEEEDAKNQRK